MRQRENFVATKNKREINQKIAELKSDSIAVVAQNFARSMAQGTVRVLPGTPIVRKQRVIR